MQTQTDEIVRTTYGQRGGMGPNVGRKLEVITSACGQYSARVFKGQRWLVVYQDDENSSEHVDAKLTEAKARATVDAMQDAHLRDNSVCMVHFYVHATPPGEQAETIMQTVARYYGLG